MNDARRPHELDRGCVLCEPISRQRRRHDLLSVMCWMSIILTGLALLAFVVGVIVFAVEML